MERISYVGYVVSRLVVLLVVLALAGAIATVVVSRVAVDGLSSSPSAPVTTTPFTNDGDGNAVAPAAGTYAATSATIAEAVAAWTKPEFGSSGHLARWNKSVVRVMVSPSATAPLDPRIDAEINAALSWISADTGVQLTRVNSGGDIVITTAKTVHDPRGAVVGAYTSITKSASGASIVSAHITLGPYGLRQVWEELTQAMGPVGDHGPAHDSVWADDHSITRPSSFDAWALHAGYQVPAGSSPAKLASQLAQSSY